MFIEKEDLFQALEQYQINQIIGDDESTINAAISAAVQLVKSKLKSRYDTTAIFEASGDSRDALIVSFVKTIAVYNLIEKGNEDILYKPVVERYDRAISFLNGARDGKESPDLPLRKTDGTVVVRTRMGSKTKFTHTWD